MRLSRFTAFTAAFLLIAVSVSAQDRIPAEGG